MNMCMIKLIFVLFQISLVQILRISSQEVSSNVNYVIWSWNGEFNLALAMDMCQLLSSGGTPVYGYFSCSIPEDKDEYIVIYSECGSSSCDSCNEKVVDTSTEYKCDGVDSYVEFEIGSSSNQLLFIASDVCFANNDDGQMVTCEDSTATTFNYQSTSCSGGSQTTSFSVGESSLPWSSFEKIKFVACFDDSLETTDDINYIIDYFSVTIDTIVPNAFPIGFCSALSAVIPEYATYTCVYDSSSSSWSIAKEVYDNDACSGAYTTRNEYLDSSSIGTGCVGDFNCEGQNFMVEIEIDCAGSSDYKGNSMMRVSPGICFYNESDSSSSTQISNIWDCAGNSERNLTLLTYFDTYNCDNTPKETHSITSSKCAVIFPEAITGSNDDVVAIAGQVSSSTNGYYCFGMSSSSSGDIDTSKSKTEFYDEDWFLIVIIAIIVVIIVLIIGICFSYKRKQNRSKEKEEIASEALTSTTTNNTIVMTRTSNFNMEGAGHGQAALPQYGYNNTAMINQQPIYQQQYVQHVPQQQQQHQQPTKLAQYNY